MTTCSYNQGYIYQPVFACRTCTPSVDGIDPDPAGFCLGCSMTCHKGHDVLELYLKRNFRCDCGTARYAASGQPKCHLTPKPPGTVNEKNEYNHNYLGRYCTCDEFFEFSTLQSYMKQCLGCQDWFHRDCMPNAPETAQEYGMLICEACVKKHGLHNWKPLCVQFKQSVCLTQGTVKESEAEDALGAEMEPMWIYLRTNWRELLCDCDKCEAKYAVLPFLHDGAVFGLGGVQDDGGQWEDEGEVDGDLEGAMAELQLEESS
ncbi:hypothetical protein BCR44DRAFT_1509467 [Catenaria anguillulae PL171]|uniref:UBR-type domain-containing protein n=1 Tax=Catenaria anguillulae PL171 TaxID=765915 RepID=A0A1Y2HZY8_9FUNG|nr:hypothetical protein BCR44DRAFT_1509467 [Catenaria anguillulae PL171]